MKPDDEAAFCQSTLVCKIDYKPFEYDDSTFDEVEPNATMSEKKNGILYHSDVYGEDSDPLPSLKSNGTDDYWNSPKLESSGVVVDDCNGGNELEFRESRMPCINVTSKLFANDSDSYTDKNIMECELPEFIVCYKESTYDVVKDICVDKILTERSKDGNEHFYNSLHSDESNYSDGSQDGSEDGKNLAKEECGVNENSVINMISDPIGLECSSKGDAKNCYQADSTLPEEAPCNQMDRTVEDASTEEFVPFAYSTCGNEAEKQGHRISCKATSARVSTAEGESEKNDSAANFLCNGKAEGETITSAFSSSESAPITPDGSPKNIHQQPLLSHEHVPINNDELSNSFSAANLAERGGDGGESSFSEAGPVSGHLITYSGQVAYSGSMSLRSDSSTTSTRSFAFPILQPEWSGSPVRMVKADRRQLQKHKGWKQGLLCCRF